MRWDVVSVADRLRIVTFSPGGRPITVLDLADGATYALQRDTPQFNPPTRNQEWSQSSVRYGGARLAHESHQNGSYVAQWYISGASTDAALANRDAFWTQLESIGAGRYLEVRPDGATRSSYAEIRGPAPWADQYRWIENAASAQPKLSVQAGFTTGPLWEGERMLIDDPFDVNSLTDYTLAHGTTLTYGAGACTTASTTEWDLIHSARGYAYGDAQTTFVYTTGGTVTGGLSRAILSWIDDNNYLFAEVAAAGTLKLWKRDGGTNTQLATIAVTALSASTKYTVAIREEGNVVFVEHWIGAPTLGTPTVTTNATLAGADATKFGFGSTGKAGFGGTWPTPSGWQANEVMVEPYTYVGRTLPQAIQLGGAIPGQAPARTDVAFSYNSPGNDQFFALFGWAARGTAPFGVYEGEALSLTGLASSADAAARGGFVAANTATTGAGNAVATLSVAPAAPGGTSLQPGRYEVWARVRMGTVIGAPTIQVTASPGGGSVVFPDEGSTALALPVPTGASYYIVRLGSLSIAPPTAAASTWTFSVVLKWTSITGAGQIALDYIAIVPPESSAATATSKAAGNPWWASTGVGTKTIQSQLNAIIDTRGSLPATVTGYQAPGLGGSVIEILSGLTDVVFDHGAAVPGDPAAIPGVDALSATARVAVHPVPRYFLPRGS